MNIFASGKRLSLSLSPSLAGTANEQTSVPAVM